MNLWQKVSLFLFIGLCFSCCLCTSAFADDKELSQSIDGAELQTVKVGDDSFQLRKSVSENNIAMSFYRKEDQWEDLSVDKKQTKELLSAMGLPQKSIDNLSAERIADLAESEEIRASVAYIKTDDEGNTTYVTKEEALVGAAMQEAKKLKPVKSNEQYSVTETENNDWHMIINIPNGPGYGVSSFQDNALGYNQYLTMYVLATWRGGSAMEIDIEAMWLNMPYSRHKDMISFTGLHPTICPKEVEFIYNYDVIYYENDEEQSSTPIQKKMDLNGENLVIVNGEIYSNEDCGGIGVLFSLPPDSMDIGTGFRSENYTFHLNCLTWWGTDTPYVDCYNTLVVKYDHYKSLLPYPKEDIFFDIGLAFVKPIIGVPVIVFQSLLDDKEWCDSYYVPLNGISYKEV